MLTRRHLLAFSAVAGLLLAAGSRGMAQVAAQAGGAGDATNAVVTLANVRV